MTNQNQSMDFESMPIEDLEKLVGESKKYHAENSQSQAPGFFKSLMNAQYNYSKGALRGAGQKLGDMGASAINWPIAGIEHLIGKQLPHVPHPNLVNEHPESIFEQVGQKVGGELAPLAIPGFAGAKSAQLVGKGYQALRGGQQLPLAGRLLAGGAGGALEGAAANEGERIKGAEFGAAAGTLGQGINEAYKFGKSLTSKGLSKSIEDTYKNISEQLGGRFTSHLKAGEEAGANQFLRPERANLKLLKKENNADLVYPLEKFNKNPTLQNAHNAQSKIAAIEREFKNASKGTIQADIYAEALKVKNRLLKKIGEAFEKAKVPHEYEGYKKTRADYAEQAGPYLDNPAIRGLLGKESKTGKQTVRPEKFAETFYANKTPKEDFLSLMKQQKKHPELIKREKLSSFMSHPATKIGGVLGGVAVAPFLPGYIAKVLGYK